MLKTVQKAARLAEVLKSRQEEAQAIGRFLFNGQCKEASPPKTKVARRTLTVLEALRNSCH